MLWQVASWQITSRRTEKLVAEETASSYAPRTADEARTQAVGGCRALAAAGQADMVWGHPSVRDPDGPARSSGAGG